MKQDEIIRMAQEAGFVFPETQEDSFTCWWEELERFAALVAEPWIETNKALAKEIIELKKQAEQEPVGWYKPSDFVLYRTKPDDVFVYAPLYAAPVRTKDLTDDEIMKVFRQQAISASWPDIFRSVIAADREKNK